MKPLFQLGTVVATPGVLESLKHEDVCSALGRHVTGDWGEICEGDRLENTAALRDGFRLMSVYRSSEGIKFWIITEADRSATTILLPDEY